MQHLGQAQGVVVFKTGGGAIDGVELAHVAPAEAAQEGAQGRGGLEREAEDPPRAASAQAIVLLCRA
jgi:hypothetical protein